MRRTIVLLIGVVVVAACSTAVISGSSGSPSPKGPNVRGMLDRLPLTFIENRGQVDPQANYYVEGAGASVYFTPNGVALSARLETRTPADLHMEFPGASTVSPIAEDRTSAVISDLSGTGDGAEGLPTYSRVSYQDLWPGIDLQFSGTSSRLKYQFLVEPGSDPGRIAVSWDGSTGLAVNDRGQLEVATGSGTVIDDTPYSYQVVGDRRVEVPTSYALRTGGDVGFRLGAYDPTLPLVIDPALLIYAGYVGGSGSDQGTGIAVDSSGNAYVTGYTASTGSSFPDGDGFSPLPGPDQIHNGNSDAFVAKVNPGGTALVYAGYIGGSGQDVGFGIAVDPSGNAYLTGHTTSTEASFPDGDGFSPLPGPDQTHNLGTYDAFVAKVNPGGTALVYAGYIGGSGDDFGSGIAVDPSGNAYVTGQTSSDQATFPDGDGFSPLPGPDQIYNFGTSDAFVAKVNPEGTALAYAGYIGGSGTDVGNGIAVDPSGNAYLTGHTSSDQATFPDGDGFSPLPGPDQTHNLDTYDAFVAKVNPGGTALVYAGYIGGSGTELGNGIAVDPSGNAYVTGNTTSDQATFPDGDGFSPLPGPDQTHNLGYDAFVARVNAAGTALDYAGYIGGSGEDSGKAIAVDGSGNAYLIGYTASDQATFPDGDGFSPLPGPDQSYNGSTDAFVAMVNSAGTALMYAGYVGGSGAELGNGIAVDPSGNAYVTGYTASDQATFPDGDGFSPLPGPDQSHNFGTSDAFVAKVEFTLPPAPSPGPSATCKGRTATVVGSAGDDTLTGTSGADVVAALEGKDTIKTLGGNDLVCAGDGNDTANGGGGKDRLNGEGGKDKLKGSGANDKLNGGSGKDACTGGSGRDKAPKCEVEKSI